MIRKIVNRIERIFEPNEFTSLKLRKDFQERFQIEVGLYSYGCFDPVRVGRNTRFGRYCSVAPTAQIFRRNHGIKFLGLTPYLYNSRLGVVDTDTIPHLPLEIGDDVWIGHNSVILPSVNEVGRGAIIGAGAIVTSDVESYSIIVGNPAKLLRMRFDQSTIDKIEATEWWKKTPEEIRADLSVRRELYFNPEKYFSR